MKKLIVAFVVGFMALGAFAWGCPGGWHPGPHPGHYPPPPHHHDYWGRGGRNFWPGFVGGLVGGAIVSAVSRPETVVVTTPVVTTPVVTTPVVTTPVVVSTPVVSAPVVTTTTVVQPVTQVQNVWVEGRYVDTVQANGTVLRTWQPGHYEQRTVVVQ